MDTYLELIERIYPARRGEQADIELYDAVDDAYKKMQSEKTILEADLCRYRIEIYFLRKHLSNAISDAVQKINNLLNDLDEQCLKYYISKLNSNLYDKDEIDKIISNVNSLLMCYEKKNTVTEESIDEYRVSA